ncbi:superoxide dismutase [Aureimonas sp. SA4125]|uniref:superoxide dismutase n=1 Tax=Aureimonas sp. SA4125 TaxID=2826993 RepID=UPI001CC794A3|nr:superoxide dismutase [Aureimonas sp. SA4125]BDA86242.1 superoxide dismutase [Aureimonas sp. SA4125]
MPIDRRTLLTLSGAAAAATLLPSAAAAQTPAPGGFTQPPLPYAEDALAPTISAKTVGLHYGKHHKSYFTKLNELAPGTPFEGLTLEEAITKSKTDKNQAIFDNAGQAWNHVFYWNQFEGGPAAPEGAFLEAATRDFGGVDQMKAAMVAEAGKVFGTGWVWLVASEGKLEILGLQDAGNPIAEGKTPLAGIDVWEHAYYLDYENRRPDHVKAVLDNLVNWRFVGEQMPA